MSGMLDDIEFKIAKLELGDGDVLVVRVDRPLSRVIAAEMTAQIRRIVMDRVPVLVIDSTMELSVAGKREAKRLSNAAA